MQVPRSHICPSCLTELARIRAVPDEHYGLPVVVCPGCKLACVRTRHPDQQFWRVYHRNRLAIGAVIGRVIFTVILGLILWGISEWATDVFADHRGNLELLEPFTAIDVETAMGAWLIPVLAMIAGFVVRLLYAHQRAWVCALILFATGFFFSSLEYFFEYVYGLLAFLGSFVPENDLPETADMLLRGKFLLMIWVLSLIGIGVGSVIAPSSEKSFQRRCKRLRKKIRKHKAYGS